ncbi:MAG: penicillin-binding protein activator LpoB [bacterium]|nr:penicillin-binding protein activator LpoB [bacterium]
MNHLSGRNYASAKKLYVVLAAFLVWGCATVEEGRPVRRVDPSKQTRMAGTGVESDNIREVADKMIRSLLSSPAIARSPNPPTIALLPVINNTRFPINKKIFITIMKARLNSQARGRMYFLAREEMKAIEAERALKRSGKLDSDPRRQRSRVAGADFFLTGRLEGHSTAGRGGVSDYIVYTFKMIDPESSVEVWEDIVEVKKEGLDDVIYR